MKSESLNNFHTLRILFLGRAGCLAAKNALNMLSKFNCITDIVTSSKRGEKLPEEIKNWKGDFIFSFRSLFVLPKYLLDNASIAAVNFHPAPVEFPGSGCLNFALYEQAKKYGVTAHIMNEKIDSGPILACKRFDILPNDTVDSLLFRTHSELQNLFFEIVPRIILGGKSELNLMLSESSLESWSGPARKINDLDTLRNIPLDINVTELDHIIKSTYTEKFPPFIKLHGYEFILKLPRNESKKKYE